MSKIPTNAALIVAAGRGHRAGDGLPKQYRPMPGHSDGTVLGETISKFAAHKDISLVCVVIHKDDLTLYDKGIKILNNNDITIYEFGGETRQQSVLNGLLALAKHHPTNVLIHDAARPYTSHQLMTDCLQTLEHAEAVIPALPVTDTLKRAHQGVIKDTVARDGLWRAQTPQSFRFETILAAHKNATKDMTDDAAVAEAAGIKTLIIDGEAANIKLTTEEDFTMAAAPPLRLPRTGNGFDVHRFGDIGSAQSVMLGGVEIAHDREIIGHSDADLGLHAITDALYGALAEGDIGDHFPPSDDRHKNRASADFLHHAVELAARKNARLTHIDLTIIAENPKIGPHRDAIRQSISVITGLAVDAVSVKATTTEKLGFTGRGEGIAAQATVTILMPEA